MPILLSFNHRHNDDDHHHRLAYPLVDGAVPARERFVHVGSVPDDGRCQTNVERCKVGLDRPEPGRCYPSLIL